MQKKRISLQGTVVSKMQVNANHPQIECKSAHAAFKEWTTFQSCFSMFNKWKITYLFQFVNERNLSSSVQIEQKWDTSMTTRNNCIGRNPNAWEQGQKLSFQFMCSHVSSGVSHRNARVVANPGQFVSISWKTHRVNPSTTLKIETKCKHNWQNVNKAVINKK